jgi:hypothetical protein
MKPHSRHKILMQLDKFRPKFRERMQSLTDIELVLVEMWFERSLMEYDRIFASMAIPACCWRRTGEIFRGNKEMAELIQVPIESLRDVSKPSPTACDYTDSERRANWPSMKSSSRISWSATGRSSVPSASTSNRKQCSRAVHCAAQRHLLTLSPSIVVSPLLSAGTTTTCTFAFLFPLTTRLTFLRPSLIVGNFLPMNPAKR